MRGPVAVDDAGVNRKRSSALVIDLVVGGLVGLVVGAIVAVNVVIYSGIADGYEAGLGDIFDENLVVGIVVVLLFITGPIIGMLVARTLRRRREEHRVVP